MESFQRLCKLCGNLSDSNSKLVDDVLKEMFDALLLKLSFDHTTQDVICLICFSKLSQAFNFKSTCLDTDDTIFRYLGTERSMAIDLREIYVKENCNEQGKSALNDLEICRLCFQPISGKHKTIQEVPFDIIQIYIPEIDFTVSTNPTICMKCRDSLCIHSTFLKNCPVIEDKTKVFETAREMLLTNSHVKTEEIEIKCEKSDEETLVEILKVTIKQETEDGVASYIKYEDSSENHGKCHSGVKMYECVECTYKTKYKSSLAVHRLKHRDASEVRTYKCGKCKFETKYKRGLTIHQLVHKDRLEQLVFKCDKCSYETQWKKYLAKHKLVHRDTAELRKHKCDKCKYESRFKYNLTQHQLVHKAPSEVKMFKCDKCEYESKCKKYLMKHELIHRDPSELPMFKCDKCSYESKYKEHLVQHDLIHRNVSEVKMFKCDECAYESKWKKNFLRHWLIHKDVSEGKVLKCDKCKYKTRNRSRYAHHQLGHKETSKRKKSVSQGPLVHENSSEVKLLKCDKCKYESKFKSHLAQHQLVHKDVAEVKMFKCDKCEYGAKWKKNLVRHQLVHTDPLDILSTDSNVGSEEIDIKCEETSEEETFAEIQVINKMR